MIKSEPSTDNAIRERILSFLNNVRVLTLSTCVANRPWSTTLAFAFEQNFNLYCITNGQTRHVQEVLENPNVSVSMYENQVPTYNPQTVKGLQLEGTAEILTGVNVLHGLKVFIGRFPKAEAMSVERLMQLKTARIIRIKPSKLYYLDRASQPERTELAL